MSESDKKPIEEIGAGDPFYKEGDYKIHKTFKSLELVFSQYKKLLEIKSCATQLYVHLANIPHEDMLLSITKLEECVMWAGKALSKTKPKDL